MSSMTTTSRETSGILEGIPQENGACTSGLHITTENGNHSDNEELIAADGEVSPSSLRRSTRASALKAQEKIKYKEGTMGMFPVPNGIEEEHPPNGENIEDSNDTITEPKAKKRKLNDGLELDQYDWKFGVRMDNDDVFMLTDESEISSLNSEEVGELRKNYEEFKQAGVSSDQQFERDLQIKKLETELRMEENKLILLKKTVQNQKEAESEALKKQKIIAEANARQQMSMNAYKPTVAAHPTKVNGTATKGSKGKQNNAARESGGTPQLDPQLQKALVQRIMENPALAAQLNLNPQIMQLLQQHQQRNLQKAAPAAPTPAPAPPPPPPAKKEPPVPTTTPAQRIAEAKRKLRQQLDQQLLSIPPPKPLVSEINFIPSLASDFTALLGLDLTVQRVLKDKNVFKKYDEENYSCEECGTDFTPSWKAIIGTENDLHLYCEKCVKDAQKKKMKHDHAAIYKKAFSKIAEQEKELEKQIAAGKFDDPPAPPPLPPPPKVATPTVTPKQQPASSLHSSASAGSLNPMAALLLQQQQQQQQQRQKAQQQQNSQASTSTQSNKTQSQSKSSKRQSNSNQASSTANNSNNSSANNNQMLINLMRSNPMMAAAMMGSNPNSLLQLQQLWNLANGANNSSSGGGGGNRSSSNNSNNLGAFALLQAAAAANNSNNSNNNQNILQNMMNQQNMLAQLALIQGQNNPNNFLLQNFHKLQQQSKSKK